MGKALTLRGQIDNLTGYGALASGLLRELSQRGVRCQGIPQGKAWEPVKEWGNAAALDPLVKSLLATKNEEGWELLMSPPHHEAEVHPCVHLTMWESNRLPTGVVATLNRKQALIVPSEWAQMSFDACGVRRPMYKVGLPISDCFRQYRPMPQKGPFTFGMCCRRAHGGLRKGVVQACEAFLAAFPSQKDVRFRLKFYPDCPTDDVPKDPRIEIIREAYTEAQVADFLESLHCYVSTSQAEGYGLVQCQAMGIGRPVIGAKAHAQAEYLNDARSYLVDYELRDALEVNPANGYYQGFVWPLKDDALIEKMRFVASKPKHVEEKGKLSHRVGAQMTWDKFVAEVLAVLRKEGLPA